MSANHPASVPGIKWFSSLLTIMGCQRLLRSGPLLSLKCVLRASSTVGFSSCEHHSCLPCYSPFFPAYSGRIYSCYLSQHQMCRHSVWDPLSFQVSLLEHVGEHAQCSQLHPSSISHQELLCLLITKAGFGVPEKECSS